MSPASRARQRADQFDHLVESGSTSGESRVRDAADEAAQAASELEQLAGLATALRGVSAPAPRAEFSADLRARLMAAAETELTPATTGAVRDRLTVRRLAGDAPEQRRQRRFTVALATLAILGGTTGTALASQGALPGDTLYPVKRAIENIHTSISQGDRSKGKTLMGDADTRLSEVSKLSQRRQADDAEAIANTLSTFSSQAQHASTLLLQDYRDHHDPASITTLHQFTKQSITQLTQISATTPPSAQGALHQAADTLLSIDQVAAQLCPSCGPLAITELPSSLVAAAGTTLDQVGGALGGTSGTSGSTDSAGGSTGVPGIKLPDLDGTTLPPATAPSATPSGGTTGGTKHHGSQGSATGTHSASPGTKGGSKHSGGKGTSSPTSVPSSAGQAVNQLVGGVTGVVGGIVGGLLGGLGG